MKIKKLFGYDIDKDGRQDVGVYTTKDKIIVTFSYTDIGVFVAIGVTLVGLLVTYGIV